MKHIPTPFAIPFNFPGIPKVGCAFGTRIGGVSGSPYDRGNMSLEVGDDTQRVISNRSSLQKTLGFDHWQELTQVHGSHIVYDPEPTSLETHPTISGDGLTTAIPGQALVIKTADCQPIMLAHKSGKYVAALHAGWRGNVSNFPAAGVDAFCGHYSLNPEDVLAVRGPSLGPAASEFVNFDDEFGDEFRDFHDPKSRTVDLWRLTRHQLTQAGILPGHIFSLDLCTFSEPEMFFSYRRRSTTGRMANLIWIKS